MPTAFHAEIRKGDEYLQPESRGPVGPVVRSRSFRVMKDEDPVPFGAFRGEPIGKVPATYLDRLRDAEWVEEKYPAVADYIDRHARAIDQELDEAARCRGR